ncbi:MAG: DUF2203 domain-containing protein [Anaerolineales bacterium]
MNPSRRFFTPDEANALLPSLIPLIEKMLRERDELLVLQPELQQTMEKAISNGNSRLSGKALQAMTRLKETIAAVHALGVELKDVNRGLVDFPSLRGGEAVYLCWTFGENEVAFWHTLESGFAGRQPLSD